MKLYLAGPMSGIKDFNFPAFHAAATVLRGLGHSVWSPAERDEAEGFNPTTDKAQPLRHYMRFDLPAVLDCDAVAVLPGWRKSKGAQLEVHVATQCSIPVLSANGLEPITETTLEEAQRLVYGDRGADYGHPLDDYTRTAALWSTILGVPVTAEQAVLCMIGVKISRECNKHKRDNLVDIPGYAECLQRIVDERALRKCGA